MIRYNQPLTPIAFGTRAAIAWVVLSLMLSGCQMTAPMHVWKAADVPRSGAVRVAVAPIGGTTDATSRLLEALQRAQPQPSTMLAAVYPIELTRIGGIQLVSYDNQPNDMATLASARRAGMDYVLQGNIIQDDLTLPEPDPNERRRFRIFKPKEKIESLTVHWSIVDVESGRRIREKTISVDRTKADKNNPELAFFTQGGDARVLMASARESWSFVSPTTEKVDAMLDLPWVAAGSSQVRKGNAYARQGNWEMAEREWQQAAHQHSWNTAAWKNLSLAAVAKEDFTLAHARLKHANTFWPGDSTYPTLNWIEQRQREYHRSLDLTPPAEGWTIPDPPKSVRPNEVPSSPPRDLSELPWWTAIPILPPPGWTWKQWLSQPIVL
jgi:hypothetical protein